MNSYLVMRKNWLTQKARFSGLAGSFFVTFLVIGLTLLAWAKVDLIEPALKANWSNVFESHQYYRLWTTLFIHSDGSHLISNTILLTPLLYLLGSYFGSWLWPFLAIFIGGLINAIVLQTLPREVALIGISGVDNWLGAAWLTLFFLIDRRERVRRRFAIVLFVTFVLFVPDTYKPGISYLSHFVGYFLGFLTGSVFYFIKRAQFAEFEVFEMTEATDFENLYDHGSEKPSHDDMSNL